MVGTKEDFFLLFFWFAMLWVTLYVFQLNWEVIHFANKSTGS